MIGYQYLLAARAFPRIWHVAPTARDRALCGIVGQPTTKRRTLPYPSAVLCGRCRPKLDKLRAA